MTRDEEIEAALKACAELKRDFARLTAERDALLAVARAAQRVIDATRARILDPEVAFARDALAHALRTLPAGLLDEPAARRPAPLQDAMRALSIDDESMP